MSEITASTHKRIYYAARDGHIIALSALLAERTKEDITLLLNHVTEEQGQKCTPLIIASRNGCDSVVRMLATKVGLDLEQEGNVKFDDYIIEGASALWCAAGAGYLKVVKILVGAGANVNHATRTKSTPLRAACFDGRLDIVTYLVEHGADLHLANKYNNTCLMIASYKGHREVVQYLLEKGAKVNEQAHCGATALHFAAECGHVLIVKELLAYGALMSRNDQNMTPLLCAAERTRLEVVKYMVSRPECTREERIEAYELLGASFANDKDNYNLQLAFHFLRRGMDERFQSEFVLVKRVIAPVAAYEYHNESASLDELDAIQGDPNALHMESLTIRERILGPNNPELPHPIVFRGAVFADDARFDRCIALWLHALKLRQRNNLSVAKDLLRFAQVFSQMLHVGVEIPFEPLEEVFHSTVLEISKNQGKLANPGPKDDPDVIADEIDCNLITALYLIVICTMVLKKGTKEQELTIFRHIFRLNRLDARTREGQSLLHLSVNCDTPVDDFHTNNICQFPNSFVCKILIDCGADVNAMDSERNTPLHIIVGYQRAINDFLTLHAVITSLIEAGAHTDVVNANGHTPYEAASTGVAEIILRTQRQLSLKCIAAKAVKKYNLSYQGLVPRPLECFIELHGASVKRG